MKKIIIITAVTVYMFGICRVYAAAELDGMPKDGGFDRIVESILGGEFTATPIGIMERIWDMLTNEITQSSDMLLTFTALAAVSGTVSAVKSSSKNAAACETAFLACFVMAAVAALRCFVLVIGYADGVIESMGEFITKFSPLLLSLVLSSGKISSAMAFKPVLSAAVYVITLIVEKCIMPLIKYGAVLSLVNNISARVQLSNYTNLIKSAAKWIMSAVFTIFAGITALYGFSAPAMDALGAKTAKFAVGSFVPVVGGLLSDSVETVVGGSVVMKNAVGTAGVAVLCTMCAVPIIKIAVIVLMLRLSAAAAQPLSDKRITDMLGDMAGIATSVLAMVITVALMFVICISIIIAATNV